VFERVDKSKLQPSDRGRSATRPQDIPAKGWRDILLRVKEELIKDKLSIVAAGVAFYALLAFFPALATLVFVYGLVADPGDVQQQLNTLADIMPEEVHTLLSEQLLRITTHSPTALSFAAIGGLLVTFWTATTGTKTLMEALNVAYDEEEKRSFLKLNGIALLLTLGAIVLGALTLTLIVALPALLGNVGLGATARTWLSLLPWPLLAVFIIVSLAVVYRYGPSRSQPYWQWVSWGAVAATVIWLVASMGFSFYVANFGNYNETYGSLGAVVILMMWLFISAYIVLLGAELNAEMEHQTKEDTTEKEPQPMGQRGAYVADTLGETPGSGSTEESHAGAGGDKKRRHSASVSKAPQADESKNTQPPVHQNSAYRDNGIGKHFLASFYRTANRYPVPALLAGISVIWLISTYRRCVDGRGR
jgi:membrane protein